MYLDRYLAIGDFGDGDQKIAVLLAATILAAPHSSLHDAVMLAIAAALWISGSAQSGQSIWKWPLALALWLAPLFNPPLISIVGRFTPIGIIIFIAAALVRGNRAGPRVPHVA